MQYRGLFKGRCQGRLPEGKGRLVLGDGSIYDGVWHNGKISGLGTFYFKRMETGGFISTKVTGEIFFGHFKDGWRHGEFLCVDVDGTRYSETWDNGVLIDRKQVDSGD
ncbi:Protein ACCUMULATION AND REPLICATION OF CHLOROPLASTS 3 [Raphanus sativus]|nr:Protein ACCUMULATION AND REPLICATION OF CHLOROPLASTS 3 [Raphanus sativus]